MKVLIIGSGGREHAIGWKIAQSNLLTRLYFAPGNPGTASLGTNIPIDPLDFEELKTFAIELGLDMMIVGPEQPLVEGVFDFFANDPLLANVKVIGPSRKAAQLEGSKEYAKQFMQRHNIPTAAYQSFDEVSYPGGCLFIDSLKPPYVLKADGLAAGKGVLILNDADEAKSALHEMLVDKKFGKASNKVVIEEFLQGVELSVFVLTDGKDYVILPEAKDYKRIGEEDTGPNTGGMGSVSPVSFASIRFMAKVEERIIKPTIEGLRKEGMRYQGFIFFGLMNVSDEPYVIEYNVRMGDPETQSVMMRIKNDLLKGLIHTASGTLSEFKIRIDSRAVATVVMVAGGYPDSYSKGNIISGLDSDFSENSMVFHAGTAFDKHNNIVTNGGRVLSVSSYGKHLIDSILFSYKTLKKISFDKAYYRRDIGRDLVSKR
ncbi:MAG: phosphoribosylamine--glycine ligase [Bacteroidales bacterium]|nr:phosphoribosylamine--glycine ligase [Bacteroidales bacterium]